MKEYTERKKKTVSKARALSTGVIAIGLLFSQTAAHAAPSEPIGNSFQRVSVTTELAQVSTTAISSAVTASKDVKISFASPVVNSTPAKKVEVPVAKPQENVIPDVTNENVANEAVVAPVKASNTPVQAYTAPAPVSPAEAPTAPAKATTAPANGSNVGDGSKASKIASAALAQVGVMQDCTALASNSLRSVGINFHDWPAGYMSLGEITNTPVPGDLIYYQNGGGSAGLAHVAVYIGTDSNGNPLAVHGGWMGNQTKVFSANLGSGPVYIHVR